MIPWLKDIAFEKIENQLNCSESEKEKIVCRLINKFFQDYDTKLNIGKVSNLTLPPEYDNLKILLNAIFQNKYFYSNNIQLSCLELCNIENILLMVISDKIANNPLLIVVENYIKHIKNLIYSSSQILDNDYFITICKCIGYTLEMIT